jgi:hypothetical protein
MYPFFLLFADDFLEEKAANIRPGEQGARRKEGQFYPPGEGELRSGPFFVPPPPKSKKEDRGGGHSESSLMASASLLDALPGPERKRAILART